MEHAIMTVEDEVIRVRHLTADYPSLYTTDAGVREIAVLAGVAGGADVGVHAGADAPVMTLTLDAMESCFDRLAALVQGRPPTQDSLPPTAAFAARLLILREFMHHLKFASITVMV
jgi:hypothetical protein